MAQKVPKREARYRRASIPGENCGTCKHRDTGGNCSEVLGKVLRNDTCDLFDAGRLSIRQAVAADVRSQGGAPTTQ